VHQGFTQLLTIVSAVHEGHSGMTHSGRQGWVRASLAGGRLLLEEQQSEGRRLFLPVKVENCVEAGARVDGTVSAS
jgi:hypothetical protein